MTTVSRVPADSPSIVSSPQTGEKQLGEKQPGDTQTGATAARSTAASAGKRPDIQGLRAIAVIAVVVYHLWPTSLPGGYVGVDVFFVISGFLITTHLLQKPPASVLDLLSFWARRVRRLLPAALLVLVVTLLAVWVLAPETQWAATAQHVRAAVLYMENWRLASDSVDYLQASDPPTAVQHFWSLAVEEQFYLVWPILILLIAALARRTRLLVSGLSVVVMALIVAGSLAFSVQQTASHPAAAYFSTPVRMWELAAGGLLAALASAPVIRRGPRAWWAAVAIGGLAAIGYACWRYSGLTPFPSWRAVLPVGGAVAIIAAGAFQRRGPATRLLGWEPLAFVGDISYSIYLWHWPLIVVVPFVTGPLNVADKILIVSGSIILAALTKRFVEDPMRAPRIRRHQSRGRRSVRASFGLAAAGMLLVLAADGVVTHAVQTRQSSEASQLRSAQVAADPCFGAASLALGAALCPYKHTDPVPGALAAQTDRTVAYADNCWSEAPYRTTPICIYGKTDAPLSIALVGNSHAGEWLPALQQLMGTDNFKVTTYLASGCNVFPAQLQWTPTSEGAGCYNWGRRVMDATLAGHFDLIVTGSLQTHAPFGAKGPTTPQATKLERTGYVTELQQWSTAGTPVLVIRDTPSSPTGSVPQCVATHESDVAACSGSRTAWLHEDPMAEAAQRIKASVSTVDLSSLFCDTTTCYGVIGGVIVYSDANHMTEAYAKTLAPYLAGSLDAALDQASACHEPSARSMRPGLCQP